VGGIGVLEVSCVVGSGAGVVGDKTKAEATSKSKVVGCILISKDHVEVKLRTVGVAETIAKAQDANSSFPASKSNVR
jgi:acetamidase/formamidase